jgi:hypothetical protein
MEHFTFQSLPRDALLFVIIFLVQLNDTGMFYAVYALCFCVSISTLLKINSFFYKLFKQKYIYDLDSTEKVIQN